MWPDENTRQSQGTESLVKDKRRAITHRTIFYPPLINSRSSALYTGYSVISNLYVNGSFSRVAGIWPRRGPFEYTEINPLAIKGTYLLFFILHSVADIASWTRVAYMKNRGAHNGKINKKKKRNHTYESLNCAHAVAESDLGTRLSLMYCKGEWIGTTWAHHRTQQSHIDGQRTVHWGRGDKSYFSKIVVPQKICTTVTKSTVIFNCCEIISAACVNEIAGPLSKWRGSRRQGELIARGEKQHSFRFKCHHVTLI